MTLVIALAGVTALAWHGRVSGLDRTLTGDLVQRPGSMGFDTAKIVSFFGSGGAVMIVAVLIAAIVWRRSNDIVLAGTVPLAAGIGGVAELVAKHLVERLRPATAVFTGEAGFGFPSGHTTGFVAMAVAALVVLSARLVLRRRFHHVAIATVAVFAIAVGVARVVVGAHYVFDIAAGMLLGVLCARVAVAAVLVVDRLVPPAAPALALVPVPVPQTDVRPASAVDGV